VAKVSDVIETIERIAPYPNGCKKDGKLVYGDADQEVTGIGVTWSATEEVLKQALKEGLNLVITHEFLFYPQVETIWYDPLPEEKKRVNIRRKKVLDAGKIAVYNTHVNWDAAPGWGIADSFGRYLGFEKEISRGRFTRVYEIPPTTVKEFALRIKRKMGLPSVRVVGDGERVVTKVGTAIGGLGQIYGFPEDLAEQGAEVAIFGEMVDYAIRCAIEYDLSVIETSHCASENPGCKGLAEQLQRHYPDLKVVFLDAGIPWWVL